MQTLLSIILILGACFVVLIGLLSVIRDLLLRSGCHVSSEFDRHDIGREASAICHGRSEHPR